MIESSFEAAQKSIQEAAYSRRLVAFVGAGISISLPSSCPNWVALTSTLIEALGKVATRSSPNVIDPQTLQSLPELTMKLYKRPEHTLQTMQSILGNEVFEMLSLLNAGEPNQNHFFLAGSLWLGMLRAVVTTNFDTHLEDAARFFESHQPSPTGSRLQVKLGGSPNEIQADLANQLANLICKLHGSIDQPRSLTATINQVGQGLDPSVRAFMRQLLAQYHVLVVGYSGNDEDIIDLLLDPDVRNDAKGITWVVYPGSAVGSDSPIEQIAQFYGSKCSIVKTRAEDFLPLCLESMYMTETIPTEEIEYSAFYTKQLRAQWNRYFMGRFTTEIQQRLLQTIETELDKAFAEGGIQQDYGPWDSLYWRISVARTAVQLLSLESAADTTTRMEARKLYASELSMLRSRAPDFVLSRYPAFGPLVCLAELLLRVQLLKQCEQVALEAESLLSTELHRYSGQTPTHEPARRRSWLARLLERPSPRQDSGSRVADDKTYQFLVELRMTTRALIGEVRLAHNDPIGALKAVAFVYDELGTALTPENLPVMADNRGFIRALIVQGRAMVKLGDLEGVGGAFSIYGVVITLHRMAQQVQASGLHAMSLELDRELAQALASRGSLETARTVITDALSRSRKTGNLLAVACLIGTEGQILLIGNDVGTALEKFETSYQQLQRLGALAEMAELTQSVCDRLPEPPVIWQERKRKAFAELESVFSSIGVPPQI